MIRVKIVLSNTYFMGTSLINNAALLMGKTRGNTFDFLKNVSCQPLQKECGGGIARRRRRRTPKEKAFKLNRWQSFLISLCGKALKFCQNRSLEQIFFGSPPSRLTRSPERRQSFWVAPPAPPIPVYTSHTSHIPEIARTREFPSFRKHTQKTNIFKASPPPQKKAFLPLLSSFSAREKWAKIHYINFCGKGKEKMHFLCTFCAFPSFPKQTFFLPSFFCVQDAC